MGQSSYVIEKLTTYVVDFHVDLPSPEAVLNGTHWKQNVFTYPSD